MLKGSKETRLGILYAVFGGIMLIAALIICSIAINIGNGNVLMLLFKLLVVAFLIVVWDFVRSLIVSVQNEGSLKGPERPEP